MTDAERVQVAPLPALSLQQERDMRYIARVMTMGDMSPASLSYAFYHTDDGEPEDIVVEVLGVYNSREALDEATPDLVKQFKAEYGEDSECWLEAEEVDYDYE